MNKKNESAKISEMKLLDQEVVDFELENQCLIVKVKQDLDHYVAVKIREKSDKLIERGYVKNIIFDFEHASFMDSSGIGVIMGRYKQVIFSGGKVAVTNVNEGVDRIFHLSGLYKIIKKYKTIKDAIQCM